MADPKLEQEVTQEVEEKEFDKTPLTKSIRFHPFQTDYKNKEIVVQPSSISQRLDLNMNNAVGAGGAVLQRLVTLDNTGTPSVKNGNLFETGGTTTITNLDDGKLGQIIFIKSDHTVTIQHNATQIHLGGHMDYPMLDDDTLTLGMFDDGVWHEISRRGADTEKAWTFDSPAGSSGTFYFGGFYNFGSTDNDFNPSITHGTANSSYAAHFFLVQATGASGGTDTVIRITGTTIDDSGNRSTGVNVDITVADDGTAGTYYETSEKWLGQVTIAKQSGPDLLMNYGFTKYWDNNNGIFIVRGIEATWLGGANDASPNIKLRHHKVTGWTYNAGATPTPPTELVAMATDHSTEDEVVNNENGAWKRDNLTTTIDGSNSEGTIIEVVTTANKTFELGNLLLRIRQA